MTIKAIVSDLGGVFVLQKKQAQQQDWEERSGITVQALFRQIDKSGLASAVTLGKITSAEVWERIAARTNVDEHFFEELQTWFFNGEVLNQELLDFFQSQRPHLKMAALSNAWTGVGEALESKFTLSQYFDVLVFSSDAGLAKPDTRIYQLVLHRLKLHPEEIIFLDDNISNVDAASLIGMNSIHFRDNAQAIAAMKKALFP
jgi:epoxide hydrolase-like predicted phosphatase